MSSAPPKLRDHAAAEIRAHMARQRKTGVELASLLQITQQSASRRLNAQADISLDELQEIAAWLDVTIGDLLPRSAA